MPIGVPGLWSSSSSSCSEALPVANATPGTGGWSFDSIERASNGNGSSNGIDSSNGNGSSNGIGSFNGNGPNRAREEFQVAGSFADPSLDIFSFGEKSFKLPAPSPTPPSTSSPSVPAVDPTATRETYESLTENAFPDFQTVAAGAREAIRSGREVLGEESSDLE
eukprot:s11210_g1.t1